MRLDIVHRTRYSYAVPARRVMQALRLWPAACAHQRVLEWRVEVAGRSIRPRTLDGFGNPLAVHAVDGPISALTVEVRGSVDTDDASGIVLGTSEPLPSMFFLGSTPLTAADAAIIRLARDAREQDDLASLHALMSEVRRRIAFSDLHTDVQTPAAQALQLGSGVCQDHAHVMIAAARSLGFAARYVSGYLWIPGDQAEPASHAWCEIEVPGLGWVGFDPANGTCPSESYVRVACGRDAREAAPIRGCRDGIGDEAMQVSVTVSDRSIQQQ
jgi:transglutaminase-like putative cysteine protease